MVGPDRGDNDRKIKDGSSRMAGDGKSGRVVTSFTAWNG